MDPACLIDMSDIEFDDVQLNQDGKKVPGADIPEIAEEPKAKRPISIEIATEAKSEDQTCLSSNLGIGHSL